MEMYDINKYEDIGNFHFKVSTNSSQAQIWVNRGLIQLYGFNLEDSHLCFLKALELDSNCLFAHWGAAYSKGPHYNFIRVPLKNHECSINHLNLAISKIENGVKVTKMEEDLIKTLMSRYKTPMPIEGKEYQDLLVKYSLEFKNVYDLYNDNLDICALYADSLMVLRPWRLFDSNGNPYEEAIKAEEVLNKALLLGFHPQICHEYIHLYEISKNPRKALDVADKLFENSYEVSHHNHMPSHIYGLLGMYEKAIYVNKVAIKNSIPALERVGINSYYNFYHCHNIHFIIHMATLIGNYDLSVEYMNMMKIYLKDVKCLVAYNMRTLEFYHSIEYHIKVRFGKWNEILTDDLIKTSYNKETKREDFLVTLTMQTYSRILAFAVLDRVKEAEEEYKKFQDLFEKLPEELMMYTNPVKSYFSVANEMALGELLYRKSLFKEAFEHLRKSVELNDNLIYGEPWPWPQPPRHALGALLLEQGYIDESIEVYKKDLSIFPNNIWSLTGLYDCYIQKNIDSNCEDLVNLKIKLDEARKLVGSQIKASCYCKKNS